MRGAAIVVIVASACGSINPPPPEPPGSRWIPIDCDAFVEKRPAGVVEFEPSDTPPAPPRDGPPVVEVGHRIAGNAQIQPSDFDWIVMARAHVRVAITDVKVCIDATGAVRGLQLMLSSGLHQYDRRFCEEMRRWRYQPWTVSGAPVPACTAVRFQYFRP